MWSRDCPADNTLDEESFNSFCYWFKIFCRFWLTQSLRLILHNQLALTKFGRCEQYINDSMVYWLGNEAAWAIALINLVSRRGGLAVYSRATALSSLVTSELKEWCSRLSKDEIPEFLSNTERKESKNTQNILLDRCYLLCEAYLQKHFCLYPKSVPKNRPKCRRKFTRS